MLDQERVDIEKCLRQLNDVFVAAGRTQEGTIKREITQALNALHRMHSALQHPEWQSIHNKIKEMVGREVCASIVSPTTGAAGRAVVTAVKARSEAFEFGDHIPPPSIEVTMLISGTWGIFDSHHAH